MKNIKSYEEFLNEAVSSTIKGAGKKVTKFISIWNDEFGDIRDINLFSDVDKKLGGLNPEWQDTLKNMKLKPEEAICVFYDSATEDEVQYAAEEAGLKYEEVIPRQIMRARQVPTEPVLGGPGIIFSIKQ